MKMFSRVMAVAALNLFGATRMHAESALVSPAETYIGSIPYSGGLMERGTLTLQTPFDVTTLRFDVPAFCGGEIFEAGTVTEGVFDVADNIGNDLFAVNSGRGARVRSVFVSINGPTSQGCSVLVFNVHNPVHTPPVSSSAVTCVTNMTNVLLRANLLDQGQTIPLSLPVGQTTAIVTKTLNPGVKPLVLLSYDRDATSGYQPTTTSLDSTFQATTSCATAASYQIVINNVSRSFDIVRIH